MERSSSEKKPDYLTIETTELKTPREIARDCINIEKDIGKVCRLDLSCSDSVRGLLVLWLVVHTRCLSATLLNALSRLCGCGFGQIV
jgi:hypothetical protein